MAGGDQKAAKCPAPVGGEVASPTVTATLTAPRGPRGCHDTSATCHHLPMHPARTCNQIGTFPPNCQVGPRATARQYSRGRTDRPVSLCSHRLRNTGLIPDFDGCERRCYEHPYTGYCAAPSFPFSEVNTQEWGDAELQVTPRCTLGGSAKLFHSGGPRALPRSAQACHGSASSPAPGTVSLPTAPRGC